MIDFEVLAFVVNERYDYVLVEILRSEWQRKISLISQRICEFRGYNYCNKKKRLQVDYFDIMCHLEKEACPKGTTLRSIRTLNAALPEGDGSLHILQSTGNSVGECLAKWAPSHTEYLGCHL